MAGKFLSVLWLYCILFVIPVCYPAEDSGILPESDVIKGSFNKNGFTGGEIIPWHVLATAEVIKIIANS